MDYHSVSWKAHNKTHAELKYLRPGTVNCILQTQDKQSHFQANSEQAKQVTNVAAFIQNQLHTVWPDTELSIDASEMFA